MDPAAPEELIEASIWWYPSLFGHRTAVLQHLLLCPGNGYEWSSDGQVRSVFAHLPPDYSTLAERAARFGGEPGGEPPALGDLRRRDLEAAALVRATARDRARACGPVTISCGSRASDSWGLMAARPERLDPRWQALLGEAGQVFARARVLQEAAEARLRRQWDRNPAARAAQLLTRQLGRAWAAEDITSAELAACDQVLACWRHPAWPSRIDHRRLRGQRDRNRNRRELARQVLAGLAGPADGQQPAGGRGTPPGTPRAGTSSPHRQARDILMTLAADRLAGVSSLVRPVPCTAWQEWDWTLDLIRRQLPLTAQNHDRAAEMG
jgi:hypothetical protein